MFRRVKRSLTMAAMLFVFVSLTLIQTYALDHKGLNFDDASQDGDNVIISVKASGGLWWSNDEEKTVTITNNSGSKATISFDYSFIGTSYTIGGDGVFDGNNYTITLDDSSTFTIYVKASADAFSQTTSTFTMSNITVTPVIEGSTITVLYDSTKGTVKNGTATVANEETVTVTADSPVTLTASATSGQFVAWVDPSDNKVLARTASYAISSTGDKTVKALFVDTTPWFFVTNSTYLVEGFDSAVAKGGTVILANNAILPARDTAYNIPTGVNMLIPFSASDTGTFGAIPEDSSLVSGADPSAFRTLTLPEGATMTVDGNLNVNGQRNVAGQGTSGTGTAKGGHGLLKLEGEGTQLTINSTGVLTCYGFVTGPGGVELNGGDLHELMQVYDWGGGTNLSGWYLALGNKKAQTLFFTSHYYVQNVEAPLKVNYGSDMYIEAALTISGSLIRSAPKIVGAQGSSDGKGLFLLSEGTYLTRSYDATTDQVEYVLHSDGSGDGKVEFGSIDVDVKAVLPVSLKSSEFTLAMNNAMIVRIGSGVNMNMGNRVALMPGSQVIVDDGGTLNLTNHLYIFDKSDKTGLFFANQLAPKYTAGRGNSVKISSTDSARLEINGELNLTGNGGIYTTVGNGSTASSNTDKIVYGTGTINHQGTIDAGTLRGGYTKDFITLQISNGLAHLAKLDGMNAFGNYTYHGLGPDHNNYWYIKSIEEDATCTADAYSKYYCTDETRYYTVTKTGTATGHSYGEWVLTTRPTSSTKGIETKTCSKCGDKQTREVIAVAQTTIADGTEMYCISLQEAIKNTSDGFITMLADTTENTYTIEKAVTIDLNKFKVEVGGVASNVTVTGIDSGTNGFQSVPGTNLGSINVAAVAPEEAVNGKYYIAITDGSVTTFHRVAVAVTSCQFIYDKPNEKQYIVVQGTFKGTDQSVAELTDLGFKFTDTGSTTAGKSNLEVPSDKNYNGTEWSYYYGRDFDSSVTGKVTVQALMEFGQETTPFMSNPTEDLVGLYKTFLGEI